MFKNTPAFSSFSVHHLQEVKRFYEQTLGLHVVENEMGILELHIHSGIAVLVYPKPDHVAATYTVLNFPVDDVETAVDRLTEQGVVFEQYGGEIATDDKGISR